MSEVPASIRREKLVEFVITLVLGFLFGSGFLVGYPVPEPIGVYLNVGLLVGLGLSVLALSGVLDWVTFVGKDWWRLRHVRVGILDGTIRGEERERPCEGNFTRFAPHDWDEAFRKRGFRTAEIPISSLAGRYKVVVNPFGERYPEEDPLTLRGFEKIKLFVFRGGIFVSAGGVPFFWAWDTTRGRPVPTGRELSLSQGEIVGSRVLIQPVAPLTPWLSLAKRDTLVGRTFQVATTMGSRQEVNLYQTEEETRWVGNVLSGKQGDAIEFRAIRESTPAFFPFLRADKESTDAEGRQTSVPVYPLAGVPYGWGLFVIAGMDLSGQGFQGSRLDDQPKIQSATSEELEIIVEAVENLLGNLRRGQVRLPSV